MEFQEKLALQAHLVKDWDGVALDSAGLVRVLNADGRQPPLIWCFNGRHEFPLLAERLGPDQPLIGLRSMHLVTRMEPGRARQDAAMADHYADILLAHLPDEPCFIGGNCQAVPVAAQLARRWLLAGRRCPSFIALEWEPGAPLPLRCRLLFGAESPMFNPYLRGDADPASRWKLMFAQPQDEIVPGAHGQYFTPQNIDTLVAAIRRAMIDTAASLPAPSLRLQAEILPDEVACGAVLPLRLRLEGGTAALPEGLQIAHIWRDATSGEVLPVAGQPVGLTLCDLTIAAPGTPGQWDLILFPALQPSGPISWHDHLEPVARLRVTDSVCVA
jgi:hypothetical protein